ncbi:subtilisin-like serine protease PR1C, partial [Metarhizium majus ARSEF 297]
MVCSSWFAFLALGVIGASPAWAAENGIESTKLADDALILECESSQACESVATAVEASGGALRHVYNSDAFHGVSFQLPESTTVDDRKALVAQFKAKDQPEDKLQVPKGDEEKRAPLGRRADDDGVETPWNHLMTHIDKLHEEGYLGSGIKIAVIDTGVDYNHPALGGCFGPGCRVVTGEKFSNEGNRSDPIDCTDGGHGTIVAGILAGYNKADGFGREDDMMAGWLKAKQDGAQLMVSSSGFRGENWAQRPLAVVAARIVASGVPCIVGLGNHKEQGLKTLRDESQHRPRRHDGEWRPVHDVDADFSDKPDDDLTGAEEVPDYLNEDTVLGDSCKLSPGNSSTGFAQDLVGHIALIRQTPETNGCHFYDGAIGITQTDDGRAMARALASGQPLTARRAGRVRIETGVIAAMSAYGPTWDMDIKPTIGAPGQDVPITRKDGGYDSDSGTSFAGPLVAGVFALVAEARGTFDPALLNSLITSTGAPQSSHGRLITVAQQGRGLLRAWEAAHASTLVEPSTLPCNDTDHRPDSIGLRITNTAKTEVTYRLSHLAAITLYTLESDSIRPSEDPAGELDKLAIMDELDKVDEAVDAAANVKISQSSLTLGPGQSATVDVLATDPSGLNLNTNLIVPYLGLGGSLRLAAVLNPASKLSTLAGSEFLLPNPPKGQTPGPSQGIAEPAAAVRSEAISTSFDLILGSPQVRVDIACVPESIVTEFAGVKSIGQLPGYPRHYVKREEIRIRWDGAFAPGQYAPPGRYKIVARALSIMGDAADESHWQAVESPVFSILYERNVQRAPENQPAQPPKTPEEEDAPAANAGDALAADDVKPAPES